MTATLPPIILSMLNNCPVAGAGVHDWLFAVARQLHHHFPDKRQMGDVIQAHAVKCGRHVPRREIDDAIRNSEAVAWKPNGAGQPVLPPKKTWPVTNKEQREAILRDKHSLSLGLNGLWDSSPVTPNVYEQQTEQIIDALFPGNPLLCCGIANYSFDTKPRDAWRGELATLQLIVPSPMSKVTGLTKEGDESKHTLDNTGLRRFLVIEFDSGAFDEHASLLLHLAGYAPLVLAVHSGRKSLHGWFYCAGQSEDKTHRFMRYAVSLGADPKTWTRSQFVRMPDGTRDNKRRQRVLFFNPQPTGGQ